MRSSPSPCVCAQSSDLCVTFAYLPNWFLPPFVSFLCISRFFLMTFIFTLNDCFVVWTTMTGIVRKPPNHPANHSSTHSDKDTASTAGSRCKFQSDAFYSFFGRQLISVLIRCVWPTLDESLVVAQSRTTKLVTLTLTQVLVGLGSSSSSPSFIPRLVILCQEGGKEKEKNTFPRLIGRKTFDFLWSFLNEFFTPQPSACPSVLPCVCVHCSTWPTYSITDTWIKWLGGGKGWKKRIKVLFVSFSFVKAPVILQRKKSFFYHYAPPCGEIHKQVILCVCVCVYEWVVKGNNWKCEGFLWAKENVDYPGGERGSGLWEGKVHTRVWPRLHWLCIFRFCFPRVFWSSIGRLFINCRSQSTHRNKNYWIDNQDARASAWLLAGLCKLWPFVI